MVGGKSDAFTKYTKMLFGGGSSAGLTDSELLERFASRGDDAEAAFSALLERHGPMVLGTCRRILDDPHEADDAFQATFLVLVRRALSVRTQGTLAPWLHGVARRVAVRSGTRSARRRRVEGAGPGTEPAASDTMVERRETQRVIDEELARLPDRYRSAVVLCYLEGMTHEEAATQLGCPAGTIKSRLARGSERLRDRLGRRGLAAPAILPASVGGLGEWFSGIRVAETLIEATGRVAMRVASGQNLLAAGASASAARLAEGVQNAMMISRWKSTALALSLLGAVIGGGAVAMTRDGNPQAGIPSDGPTPAAPVAVAASNLAKQVDEAVKAVIAVPVDPGEPNNTPPYKIYNLIQLGTIQAETRDVEAARATFRQAYRDARELPKNVYQSGTMARLARAQAGVGDAEGTKASLRMALDDLEHVRGPLIKANNLAAIIAAQAKMGDAESVQRGLERIGSLAEINQEDPSESTWILRELIWATARAGRFDEAFDLVLKTGANDLLRSLSEVALPPDPKPKKLRRNGLIDRNNGLKAIAEAIVSEHGELGREALRRIISLGVTSDLIQEVAIAQARVGDIDAALQSLQGNGLAPEIKAVALPPIAVALLDAGRRHEAVDTLRLAYDESSKLIDHGYKFVRFQHIASAQIRAGDFAGAIRSAKAMGPRQAATQVLCLMQTARGQEKAGDRTGAARTRAQARVVAEERRLQPVEESLPGNMTVTDGRGDPIRDKNAPELREDYGRCNLAQIAATLGYPDEAGRLIDLIRNPDLKTRGLASLAASYATQDDVSHAIQAASRLESPQARLQALSQVARILADNAGVGDATTRSIRP